MPGLAPPPPPAPTCFATPTPLASPAGMGMGIPRDPPKKRGGVGEQRHRHTFMSDAGIASATAGPGDPGKLGTMGRGSRGVPGGRCWRGWGGDERRPAGPAASLSSCQMSPKGWKNRSGLGVLRGARLPAALQLFPEKSKKCTRLGSPVLPPQLPGLTPSIGGPGKQGGMGSWRGDGDGGTVLTAKPRPLCPSVPAVGEPLRVTAASRVGVFWRLRREALALVPSSPRGDGNMATCPRL